MSASAGETTAGRARIASIASRGRIGLRRLGRRIAFRVVRSRLPDTIAEILAIFDRRRALHLTGSLAAIRHRHADHTDLWRRAASAFPRDPAFTRALIHAALLSGRIAEAEAGFEQLVAMGAADLSDCRFVIGLSNGDQRRGDTEAIRTRIRRFLASLRGRTDYRIAAVRLNRLLLAYFSRTNVLGGGQSRLRARFLSMLQRSAVNNKPGKLLVRVASCEARLEIAGCQCLLDTDVSAQQRAAFLTLVRERLSQGTPFSFVRIGDGDAACLPYEPRLASLAAADAKDRERIWWGVPLSDETRASMAPRIARAMWDADCIGIPTIARFLRELRLKRNDDLETSLTGRGLRSILYCTEHFGSLRTPGLPPPIFTSCHLHQELAQWDCYKQLFDGVKEVALISCHPDLADWFSANFGVGIAAHLVLPPDNVSAPLLSTRSSEERHLPEMLHEVIESISDLPRGRLVLVGAGYPGKLLVCLAKNHGSIALDLGSIFDYWMGLNTRSYLDMSPT